MVYNTIYYIKKGILKPPCHYRFVLGCMGGHVRVGLEDNLYMDKGVIAGSNAELVEMAVHLFKHTNLKAATPEEARVILG